MKKRMYKIMALAMTAAMVVPMAAQTTVFAADDKEITYWNIAVESPDKDIVTAAVDKFNKETKSGYTVNQVAIQLEYISGHSPELIAIHTRKNLLSR